MIESKQFLLRKVTGDQMVKSEQEVHDWFQKGQCKLGDFLYDFSQNKWFRLGDHPLNSFLTQKPTQPPEKKLIYFMAAGPMPLMQGPYSLREFQQKAQAREVCEGSWVFVEGDKEWRQVRAVKALLEMLTPMPSDIPAPPVSAATAIPVAIAPAAPPPQMALSAFSPPVPFDVPSGDEGEISLSTNPSLVIELSGASAPPAAPKPSSPPPSAAMVPPASAPPKMASAPAAPPMFAPEPMLQTSDPVSDPGEPGDHIEREEDPTMAFSMLGLSLEEDKKNAAAPAAPPAAPPKQASAPPPKPAMPGLPPKPPGKPVSFSEIPPTSAPTPAAADKDQGSYDGLTAEIPGDPIWMVKPANAEVVSGPFRFLDVVKFLEQGKISKNDKISKSGTNRFVKIQQQYEFNVKFSLETVIEHGVEKQKILIRRRHPRVPYIADVQVVSKHGLLTGSCVNISAGGILMEMSKAEFSLGDIIEVKILPALITKPITCKSMVIGRIPKIPPAFALKFEDLKNEDKEAIEFFVQEALKREMP